MDKKILGSSLIGVMAFLGCDNYNKKAIDNVNFKEDVVSLADEGCERVRVRNLRELYPNFRFQDELETIRFHAERVGVDVALMLAIREAENGREGLQFGVPYSTRGYDGDNGYDYNGRFHQYLEDNDLSKQTSWAAWTVFRNIERYNALIDSEKSNYTDFIDFLSRRYAPKRAKNDPKNLNKYWPRNVRGRYNLHIRQS